MPSTAAPTSYLRYPDIRGDRVVFVARDDVWLAPADGGPAWRLSDDRVPATYPRLSPDGSVVAWGSSRTGAVEVVTVPTGGGEATQLTWWGSKQTRVLGWRPGSSGDADPSVDTGEADPSGDANDANDAGDATDEILVVSSAGEDTLRDTWARAIRPDGSTVRLPFGPVSAIAAHPDGATVLCSAWSREPAQWKRYRGGTAPQLWIDRNGSGEFVRLLPEITAGLVAPTWIGDRLVFCSDHEGVANLYSVTVDGDDLRRHTSHDPDDGYVRNPSGDGARIVYHALGRLYVLDSLDDAPRQVPISLPGAAAPRARRRLGAGEGLTSVRPLADGSASLVEQRGTVHLLTHRDGPARTLTAADGVRVREAALLGGTGRAIWVTDADGEDALEVRPLDGSTPVTRLAVGELGRVMSLRSSPDGSHVAVVSHDGTVRLVDVDGDGAAIRTIHRAPDGEPERLTFSPDGRYLAWSEPVGANWEASRLMLADLGAADADGLARDGVPRVYPATSGRFSDSCPAFTADGKYLAFLSARTFDPVYDVYVFDISFPVGTRPYLMPLAADTALPFGPTVEGWGFAAAGGAVGSGASSETGGPAAPADAVGSGAPDSSAGANKAGATVPSTVVDVAGLEDRAVAFPVPAGRYRDLQTAPNGVWWLSEPLSGTLGAGRPAAMPPERPTLHRWDFAKRKDAVIVDALDSYAVSGDGTRIVVRDGESVLVLPADHKVEPPGEGERVQVDLARLRVDLDPVAEWRQMVAESWRLMRDHFWRADLGGVDWAAALARYLPLVDAAAARDDVYDLIWELQAELGTSHAYVMTPPTPPAPGTAQGLLGADLAPDEDGVWRVRRILPGDSSDPAARSPLRAAGVAAVVGDAVLSVGGVPVGPLGPAPLLAGAADSVVELELRGPDAESSRRVAVQPVADEEGLRYQAWVAGRRSAVDRLSDGRVGYLHVPDMQALGWAQIHRDFRLAADREAIVVDVRYNRGGHLSQLVVERLARRVIGWDLGRYRAADSYPNQAPRGPIVFVSNQWSGSDGDIVCAAARAMGIGPIVGVRTWGGVVGIDGRFTLADGTVVTQPRYATWMQGFGFGLENHGVDPDIEVPFPPQAYANNADPQLERAVAEVLRLLDASPAAVPPEIPPLV